MHEPLVIFLTFLFHSAQSQCTTSSRPQILSASSGSFSSPNYPYDSYPHGSNCSWRIAPMSNSNVTLTIVDFYTEYSRDFVDLYNGYDSSSTRLSRLSGSLTVPRTFYSTQRYMYITFQSDSIGTARGFSMTYTSSAAPVPPYAGCMADSRPAVFTDLVGTFSSPSFPTDYSNNADCRWQITGGAYNAIVTLTFSEFATEACCDFLSIYDGRDAGATRIATLSGILVTPMRSYTSSFQNMFVQFTSDGSDTERGFKTTYIISTVDTGTGDACSVNKPRLLTTYTGSFTSPNFPQDYPINSDCQWRIQSAVEGGIVILVFNEFITYSSGHSLEICDGSSASSRRIALLSGSYGANSPGSFYSSQVFMFLQFKTPSGSGTAKGFMATYRSSPTEVQWCSPGSDPAEVYGLYGTVKSLNYPNNYPANLDCRWKITAQSYSGRVTLVIDDFRTTSNSDFLDIIDGELANSKPLSKLSGTVSTPLRGFYTSQRHMLLRFTSISVNRGFIATYITSEVLTSTGACSTNGDKTGLTISTATITSPNYPLYYNSYLNCQWLIAATESNLILAIDFNYFDTQSGQDFVVLYDGLSNSALTIATLSGQLNSNLPGYRTTQMYLFMQFSSAANNQRVGFCATIRSATRATVECDVDSPPLQLTGNTGTFTSPKYPDSAPASTDCKWLITSPSANGIVSVVFDVFRMNECCDSVYVFDGNSSGSSLIRYLSGDLTTPSRGFITTQRFMFITFSARQSAGYRGFSATYTSSTVDRGDSCSQATRPRLLISYTGTFTSPNYPGNYYKYSECHWRINSAEESTVIHLDFHLFYLTANLDFVNLFDGESLFSPQIASLTGFFSNPPGSYVTTTNYMFVQFVSSATITQKGFIATYRPAARPFQSTTRLSTVTTPRAISSAPEAVKTDQPWIIAVAVVVPLVVVTVSFIVIVVIVKRRRLSEDSDSAGTARAQRSAKDKVTFTSNQNRAAVAYTPEPVATSTCQQFSPNWTTTDQNVPNRSIPFTFTDNGDENDNNSLNCDTSADGRVHANFRRSVESRTQAFVFVLADHTEIHAENTRQRPHYAP